MEIDSAFQVFGISLQVFLIDLLLSGDNAVVIALACRTLPARQRRLAMLYGAGAGILLRLFLTLTVSLLLKLPLLKIIGSIALLLIAIDLMTEEEEIAENLDEPVSHNLSAAVMTIVAADLVMSLDNVVALSAVSQGSATFLVLGLLLSVPLLFFGSGLLSRLMDEMPELITLGGALLGWVAGGIAVTDPLIAHWVETQSPALVVIVPLATAILTVMQSRHLVKERQLLGPRTRQPLKLPTLQLWSARQDPKTPPAEIRQDETEALPATPGEEAAVTPIPVLVPGNDGAMDMDDELGLLIGERNKTAPAEDLDSPPAGTPETNARSAWWDMRTAFALIVFVMLLVMLMSAVTDNDQPTHTRTPNFAVAPIPDALKPFQCGLYDSVFFYHHGSMQVRFQAGKVMLSGVLNRNTLTWKPQSPGAPQLGFMPPTTVLDDTAKSVTVTGGSFSQTVCQLGGTGMTGP